MKNLLLISLVLLSTSLQAKNFYISSTGNDANNGLSSTTPWQSIAKLNASFGSMAAGDSILFKSNEIFYGSIIVGKSGTTALPIVFGAYGIGAKPVISGFTNLTNWTNSGGGIWKTNVASAKKTLMVLAINNQLQRMGRFPNYDATNAGYLTYEDYNGGSPSITDNQLTSATNWTGASAVIRKVSYVLDVCKITSHNGSTITYTNPTNLSGEHDLGYFIQNDLRTLDQFGEWYLNPTTKDLSVYFGSNAPTAYSVKASVVDTVFNFRDLNTPIVNVVVDGLAIEGANTRGLFAQNNTNLTIKNCLFNNNYNGIYMWNVTNSITDNNTVSNTLNNGIIQYGQGVSPTTIKNNTVKNCGLFAGMGDNGAGAYSGIQQTGDNTTIEYNRLDSIGFNGIKFYGSNLFVKNNFIANFCAVLDDGAGIYTYQNVANVTDYVQNNIVIGGIGARKGRVGGSGTHGIYMDNDTHNVKVLDNSVSTMDGHGVYLNTPADLTISGNTIFQVETGIQAQRYPNTSANPSALVRNMIFTKNIIFPNVSNFGYWNGQLNEPYATDIQTDMRAIGTFNDNYYRKDILKPFDYYWHTTKDNASFYNPSALTLDGWKPFINGDANSKLIPTPPAFIVNSIIGGNKKLNSGFNSDMSNYYVTGSNLTYAWDNSSKITGTGSAKITATTTVNDFSSIFGSVGAIAAGKNYILKFKTLSTVASCAIKANVRQSNAPYATLVAVQNDFASNKITQHQFLIKGVTDADASVLIDIEQKGTTYIDDIEFYEVSTTTQDANGTRFEYNDTKQNKTIALGANYIGVDNTKYGSSITLAPFTAKILVRDTGNVVPPVVVPPVVVPPVVVPPAASLIVTATASTVKCFGGNATAVVSATGGTAPYTGTGSFAINTGKGSLKISCAAPVINKDISAYWSVGALNNTKTYVLRFSTLGSIAAGTIKASLRQTDAPYATVATQQSKAFGTARVDHEFVFANPTTCTDASFLIDLPSVSGTTFIDNISFFETNATGALVSANTYTAGDFETGIGSLYSASENSVHLMEWDTTGKINATKYFTVTDAAGVKSTKSVVTNQPTAAVKATATAPAITIYGGATIIALTATGGVAPYTGTGNFTVTAGTYNYTVTDANGCATTASITLTQPINQPLVTAATATAIKCFGGTTTATVTATGGVAPYTGTGTFVINTGKGALKISCAAPVINKDISAYWTVGALSNTKSYVLKFSTLGSIATGTVKASLRQTGSPYATVAAQQSKAFGTARVDHEFIFTNPTTCTDASFLIDLPSVSGTTYIDNIAFFETNATGALISANAYTDGDFESGIGSLYAASENSIHLMEWDNSGKINATKYFTITDAAGTKRTSAMITNQPAAAVKATAAATTIAQFGGSAVVTVSATGGTSPYAGTGNFTVKAGTYTYPVTDANGCTNTTSIVITQPINTPFTAIASANAIACFDGSTTANVTATGGTSPYVGTGAFMVSAGKGALKISCAAGVVNKDISTYWTVGAVSNTKSYVLRFSTLGSVATGTIKASLRQTGSPYATVAALQSKAFGTARVDHEFVFNNPTTCTDASFLIDLPSISGTTYIDNIAFFEINTAGALISANAYPAGDFETGITALYAASENNIHTLAWDNSSKINGTKYFTLTDATGAKRTTSVVTSQPTLLVATAKAAVIASNATTTTVVISATGGKAPYKATGNYTVAAGTYTYIVTDANGCTSTVKITVTKATSAAKTDLMSVTGFTAETELKLTLAAYPNPSTTSFNLRVQGGSSEKVTISVISYDGVEMFKTTGNSNQQYSFGNNFIAGMYVVIVKQGSTTQTLKLIKTK